MISFPRRNLSLIRQPRCRMTVHHAAKRVADSKLALTNTEALGGKSNQHASPRGVDCHDGVTPRISHRRARTIEKPSMISAPAFVSLTEPSPQTESWTWSRISQ